MYLLWIYRGFAKHRFVGHTEVALCIVGRYVALITEEKLDLAPRHLRLQQRIVHQESVQGFRRGTASKRDGERVFFAYSVSRSVQKFSGRPLPHFSAAPQHS